VDVVDATTKMSCQERHKDRRVVASNKVTLNHNALWRF
jgi:hypothetical protein